VKRWVLHKFVEVGAEGLLGDLGLHFPEEFFVIFS